MWARIYIAGDPFIATRICRQYCDKVGLCVTISATDYVYTGGSERGVIVGLNQYPKYPDTDIETCAVHLANKLLEGLLQDSFMIQTPEATMWHTTRGDK